MGYGGLGGYYGNMPVPVYTRPYVSEANMSATPAAAKASESDIERAVSPLNESDLAAACVLVPGYDEYARIPE